MVSGKDLVDWFGKPRGYAHLDEATGSVIRAAEILSDPKKAKQHGFFPFIQFESKQRRLLTPDRSKSSKVYKVDLKRRKLAYCSHVDRYIYSYYSRYLNEKYNEWAELHDLDECVVAYRSSDNCSKFLHKNNITHAKAAFEFINKNKPCRVVVSDFNGYFDNIDHQYLKHRLCELLNVYRLDEDLYAVYKNITKFSFIEKGDIDKYRVAKGIIVADGKEGNRLLTKEEFAEFRENGYIQRNRQDFGIPQGSPISAVLSNIYLLKFDLALKKFADKYHGLYIRYCDDLILIIPDQVGTPSFVEIYNFLNSWTSGSKIPHLECSTKKTRYFYFDGSGCFEIDRVTGKSKYPAKSGRKRLDYLGFVFDGSVVRLRPKSILKYYYRVYKKISNSVRQEKECHKGGGRHNIYVLYSDKIYRNINIIPEDKLQSRERYIRLDRYAQGQTSARSLYNFKIMTIGKNKKRVELRGNYITYVRRVKKTFEGSDLIFDERILSRNLMKIGNRFRRCQRIL